MSLVNTSKKDGLGILEFDKSVQFLTVEILDEFKAGFRELANDDEVKLIILFAPSAVYGMDISFIYQTMKAGNRAETEVFLRGVHDFIEEMYEYPKQILGAVLGTHLLGGALELFLPCDYLWILPDTLLGLPECGIGIMPGYGGTHISRRIGVRRTAEMIATAKMYSAQETLKMGLADGVMANTTNPKEEIIALATTFLNIRAPKRTPCVLIPEEADFTEEELLYYAKGKSRLAVTHALEAVHKGAIYHEFFFDKFKEEREYFLETVFTPNAMEGVKAFMQKRKPVFTDAIDE